ncbi:hypothetical protein ACMFMF_005864 [Clarireedia jacksonii]
MEPYTRALLSSYKLLPKKELGPSALPNDAVHKIAQALVQAEQPLLITGCSGRDLYCPEQLVAFAELILGLRIYDVLRSDICFPFSYQAFVGYSFAFDDCNVFIRISFPVAYPWRLCVTAADQFGGSCANCYYSSEGTRCSFCRRSTSPSVSSALRPRRQRSRPSFQPPPLPQVAPVGCIFDQVAPGSLPGLREDPVRDHIPFIRAHRFAEHYRELAALYTEEAVVLEDYILVTAEEREMILRYRREKELAASAVEVESERAVEESEREEEIEGEERRKRRVRGRRR